MSAFSEMEAAIIRERVIAGLSAAKDNGQVLGRPPLHIEREQTIQLFKKEKLSPKEIASKTGLGVSTVYKIIKEVKDSQVI